MSMTHPMPVVAEATAAPRLRTAAPSLAAAISTTMAMVDYALVGEATPTPEPQAVAHELAPDLVEASHPLRAVLAHGTALRSYLLAHLPADHPGHADWPPLRRWLVERDDAQVRELLAHGVAAVLGYQQPPGTTPTAAEVGASPATLQQYAVPVLEAWRVPDAAGRVAELDDLAGVRATLRDLLDAVWHGWLGQAWQEQLPAMRAAADGAPPPPPGCPGTQWIALVTGLRPDPPYAAAAERAAEVTVMPCPGLGRSLSLFSVQDDDAWVLFTPSPAATAGQPRTGISVQRLGELAPALHALGDRTRLAIVLHLLEHGALSMPELANALQVHQSTISRQVAALRRAQLVAQDGQRRLSAGREALRRAAQTLLEAVE